MAADNTAGPRTRTSPKKYHTVDDILRNTTLRGDCMEWNGAKDRYGYPAGGIGGIIKGYLLHREVFRLVNGTLPPVVMHTCDNRACINPAHLVAGNNALNIADRNSKNRQAKRANNGNAKLTEADVAALRQMKADGATTAELVAAFGISRVTVWRVASHINWK